MLAPIQYSGMVQNLTYTGDLRCGDARSELMPDLQIVPQEQFENAQRIRNERSVRSTAEAENRLPLNIHGKSLLAGNAYCGHCGAKLELTSSRKWRKMADGSLDDTLRIRYTCYGKLRKQTNCTGQTGYTVHILDEIIDKAVRQIFSKMRGIPKEQIVTKRYEKENAERKNHLQDLQTQRNKAEKDLFALKTEVLACIKGESVLPRETLAEMITAQEEKLTELENLCEAASEELEKTAELMDKVSRLYDELISYADLYDSANFEAKKMIVNQLIRRVDVYRGYQINISFNFDLTPYIEGEDTSACKTVGHRTSIFKNNETARIGGCRPYACKIRHLADFQCDLQESKKKSTILPTKYSAFLVENSGIEPLTSCMPCKRSPS